MRTLSAPLFEGLLKYTLGKAGVKIIFEFLLKLLYIYFTQRRRDMCRQLEFDREKALEKATRLFWRKGYEKTTVAELLKEMNILNGSFYNAFKDKKNLFLESLEYYNSIVTAERLRAFDDNPDIRAAIREFFRIVFTSLSKPELPNGCMMTNSMTDEVFSHSELKEYVVSKFTAFERYVADRIQAAMDRDEFHADTTAEQLASLIVTYLQGVFRLSNMGTPVEKLQEQTNFLLTSIGF